MAESATEDVELVQDILSAWDKIVWAAFATLFIAGVVVFADGLVTSTMAVVP
ncbi:MULTISPECIES: hypothetical protein [unclassified Haloferax]|uniref:hypothetical protein n=1 Tax=unclassified Haloferax TaxID=2625095 RepID=UPI0013143B23|nr:MULTISPECIES: hypothetical protein [unclassified Haloferax]